MRAHAALPIVGSKARTARTDPALFPVREPSQPVGTCATVTNSDDFLWRLAKGCIELGRCVCIHLLPPFTAPDV